ICGQDSSEPATLLPVTRIVLYKNGVGYFEHLGHIRDSENVTIPFTSGQLNDVLKSLTVLDLNGGRIGGVSYDSSAPVEKQLGDVRLSLSDTASLTDFLRALRGARLEVRSGAAVITGRLLSIERKTRSGGGTTLEVDYVSLITDGGDVRTTELAPGYSVRLLDRGLPGKVDRFLDLLSAAREPDVRRLVISTEGTGDRSLFISYISEVPVWKATYRIILGSKAGSAPLLQGWAIVDNTVGQDWENVQLSLVAGAPQSFIQNLSQPYYARRPVVPLPESVAMSPQTFEATLIPGRTSLSGVVTDASGAVVPSASVKAFDVAGNLAGETTTNTSGLYEFQTLPEGPVRLEINAPGFNRAIIMGVVASLAKPARQDATLQVGGSAETVAVTASAPGVQADTAQVSTSRAAGSGRALGSGAGLGGSARHGAGAGGGFGGGSYRIETVRAQAESAALAQELGDLFEYKLKEPITIKKNRSALVPIVNSPIGVEKVSIYNESAGLPRPQRALWLNNSTGLTLDGGSFSVFEDEAFAGEGIFDPIRPGEKRLVSYATDLGLNASSRGATEDQAVSRVRIDHGVMIQESGIRETKTYTFRNEDTSTRTVIVEHPVRPGYELRGETRPVETTSAWMRFRLQVEPKQTASIVVDEMRPTQTTYQLTNLTSDQVTVFVRQRSVDATVEAALRRILQQKEVVDNLDTQKSAREDETQKIFDDQQRLRENMKALKGSPEEKALLQRYTRQLDEEENGLDALKKEIEHLGQQQEAAQDTLNKMIADLSFDVKL
ncbi:MAG: carboxypeptidase regulatory-like domain-containing protein, partial [Bryobacteraceae bacterium]